MKQRIQITRIDHRYRFLFCPVSFIDQIAGDLKSCGSCPFSAAALKHVKLFVFNRKLHILHIMVMILQGAAYIDKFCVCFREFLLHLRDRHRRTNACYNVLSLCVDQELSHHFLFSGSRVTCKRNARTGFIIQVSEYHRHYADSCSP